MMGSMGVVVASTKKRKYPGLTRSEIASITRWGLHKKDLFKRRCAICDSNKTKIKKQTGQMSKVDGMALASYPLWYRFDGESRPCILLELLTCLTLSGWLYS